MPQHTKFKQNSSTLSGKSVTHGVLFFSSIFGFYIDLHTNFLQIEMQPECPTELMNYINKLVQVTTKFRTTRQGIVLTIDPETLTVILLDNDQPNKTYIINGETIKLKTILDSSPSYETKAAAYMATISDRHKPGLIRTPFADTDSICLKLLNWLTKNNYETVNENGILKISDNLIILSPYGVEQCICNDKIFLEDVKKCISNMPR